MEVRQYFLLFRKWVWLLILGTLLGGGAAYIISRFQPVVYQTTTSIMVSQPRDQQSQNAQAYANIQLTSSYTRIINTGPVLMELAAQLGYEVKSSQIGVRQVSESQLIVLSVSDSDPNRAAEIANTLVKVFIVYNDNLQNDRYQAIEENLQAQIEQIEGQITTLQTELANASESMLVSRQQQIEEQTRQLERLIAEANQEVMQIDIQISTYIPTAAVTNTPAPSWIIPTATSVPIATPTLSAAGEVQYREMQIRREQLEQKRTLLQDAYGNLLLLQQNSGVDPALRQDQIQTTLALYQQIYTGLLSNYENVRLSRLRSTPTINQIEPALAPSSPIRPQPLQNSMVGATVGLMLMGAIAFLIEYLDDTIKTPEDVQHSLHLPILGLIGEMEMHKDRKGEMEPGIFVLDNPISPITEGFRTLRANLEFASVDQPIKIIEVTSPSPSEGKTTIAINLAGIISQSGRKVLLLDADFRKPAVHRRLGLPNRKGLADLFRDPSLLPDVINHIKGTTIMVITTGALPPNPSELLASDRMVEILNRLKELADVVIIDTPPVILSDPMILAAKVDGVLVVIKPGGTRIGAAQIMMEQLKRAGARVFGAVLNPISPRSSHYYTKYNYYSSYYYKSSGYGETGKNGKDRHNDLDTSEAQKEKST